MYVNFMISFIHLLISEASLFCPYLNDTISIAARGSGSQDELDDESVQGKHQQFDSFSVFSSE